MINVVNMTAGRLHEQRQDPSQKRRLFQLIADAAYPSHAELKNRKITLHCTQLGGFGDVSQTYLCAELIKQGHPEIDVQVLIELQTASAEKIRQTFPVDRFKTMFLSSDYFEKERQFQDLAKESYPLGIAAPVGPSGPYQHSHPHLRTIKEYGFAWHPDTKNSTLSMGLGRDEEGICFPKMAARPLSSVAAEWLRPVFGQERYLETRKLYHMYVGSWEQQLAAIYSVAAVERGNCCPIDLFVPVKYSLKQLVEWGILDLNALKECGIGTILKRTAEGIESIRLGEGKELQILSGAVAKTDMEAIQQHAQAFFGCTGDLSFSEAVALDKLPFYEILGHKVHFFESLRAIAWERRLPHLTAFFNALKGFFDCQNEIYERRKPKKHGFYDTGPSMDLSDPNSLSRKCVPELAVAFTKFGGQVALLYQNPALLIEARQLAAYLKQSVNFEERLIAIVNRGIFLQNHPDLIAFEEHLFNEFEAGKKSESQVVCELRAAIVSLQ